jgi:hypothetical protein
LWRCAEVGLWHAKILLDRDHRYLVSPERNLVFVGLDGITVVTALACLLEKASPASSTLATWNSSLSVVTLNGAPSGYAGAWTGATVIVGTVLGLLLLGGGLALLVGLISDRFKRVDLPATAPLRHERPHRLAVKQPPVADVGPTNGHAPEDAS